jgi:hypothetical protein
MVHIIETNLSLNNDNIICDHQARVIEYSSWNEYVKLIKEQRYENRNGTMDGCILPRNTSIDNLIYDDYHLSCDVITAVNTKIIKFAYLISTNIKIII